MLHSPPACGGMTQNAPRKAGLVEERQMDHGAMMIQEDRTLPGRTDCGNGVGDEHVTACGAQFFSRLTEEIAGFECKSDHHLVRAFPAGHGGQDVRIRDQREGEPLRATPLHFVPVDGCRAKVGDRRGHDDDVGGGGRADRGTIHVARRDHPDEADASWRHQRGRSADERDACATLPGQARQCVPELPRRCIGHKTDRVDRFVRGSRGNDHMTVREYAHTVIVSRRGDRPTKGFL